MEKRTGERKHVGFVAGFFTLGTAVLNLLPHPCYDAGVFSMKVTATFEIQTSPDEAAVFVVENALKEKGFKREPDVFTNWQKPHITLVSVEKTKEN